jgi:ATP-dependent DNA helicase RecG
MDDRELELLLADIESDRTERKASAADGKKLRQAICAFANDMPGHRKPGVLFVGVHDGGACAGLDVDDRLLLTLASIRDDGLIQPLPTLIVQKRVLSGCTVAVVIVEPSDAPPVRYEGRVWVRVGPRRGIATKDEERILSERRRARDLPFELRSLPSTGLVDLDLVLFERVYLPAAVAPDVLAANDRTIEERLRALRLLDPAGHATVLGILVLGKDVRGFVPGASVQFVRFEGNDLSSPIRDQKEIVGALPDLLERLDQVLEAHNEVATDVTSGPLETRRPEYPLAALQQLVRNAVLHRSYEGTHAPVRVYWFADRVEIHSPGGPFGQVNRENFGQPGATDYRNLHLAEAVRTLGYAQRFGVGIALARAALAKNGNPPPEFDVQPGAVLAVLRRSS